MAPAPLRVRPAGVGLGPDGEDVEDEARAALLKPVRVLLAQKRLGQFLEGRPLEKRCSRPIVLDNETSIAELLLVLAENDILSVPVVDSKNPNFFHGFVDVADVCEQMLHEVYPHLLTPGTDVVPGTDSAALMRDTIATSDLRTSLTEWNKQMFLSEPLSSLKRDRGPSARTKAMLCPGEDGDFVFRGFHTTTLLDLVSKALQRPTSTFSSQFGEMRPSHRIAVFTVEGEERETEQVVITDIISQMDIAEHMLSLGQSLGDLANTTIEDLGLVDGPPVLCVTEDMTAVGAFALMQNMGVTGCAIVGQDGGVVDNISQSDLRCISDVTKFDLLLKSVKDFKAEAWPEREVAASGAVSGPVTCVESDTLLEVLRMLVTNRIHRTYCVREGRIPHACITLTDCLRLVAIEPDEDAKAWMRRNPDECA